MSKVGHEKTSAESANGKHRSRGGHSESDSNSVVSSMSVSSSKTSKKKHSTKISSTVDENEKRERKESVSSSERGRPEFELDLDLPQAKPSSGSKHRDTKLKKSEDTSVFSNVLSGKTSGSIPGLAELGSTRSVTVVPHGLAIEVACVDQLSCTPDYVSLMIDAAFKG